MKTILQKIIDALEVGGVSVVDIETYPSEDDEDISVSLRVRTKPQAAKAPNDCHAGDNEK